MSNGLHFGNLLNHIVTIIDITNFLYGQICNLEHRNTCNERMKKLGDRSYKYDSSNKTISAMNNKGESND